MTTRTVAGSGVQSWTSDAEGFTLRAGQGVLKVLDTALDPTRIARWVELNPSRPVVVRLVRGDDLAGLPARTDQTLRLCAPLAGIPGIVLYAEIAINEAYQAGDDLSRLNDATVLEIPRYESAGVRPVVGNFSVGMPNLATAMAPAFARLGALGEAMLANPAVKRGRPAPLAPHPTRALRAVAPAAGEWRRFVPAIRAATAAGGLLGLHEYAVPGALWWDGWWNGRYVHALEELAGLGVVADVGIGEHFVDGGVLDGNLRGWRAFGLTDEQGAALLDTSLSRYAADPRVRYVALFEGGPYDDWRRRGFEYDTSTPIRAAVERQRQTMEEPMTTLTGVDVSNWQQIIDWQAVAASGRSFAWIKASEDPGYRDPYFAANWAGATSAGMTRGCYHFAQPDQAAPEQSVALLEQQLAAVGGLASGDLVALDIESGSGDLLSWVVRWCTLCEERLGVVPVLYSGLWFMRPHGLLDPALVRYPLWYASYQPSQPPAPAPWDRIAFWQFSAHGQVPGINGDVDENTFNGDRAALAALGFHGGTMPTDPTTLRDRTYALAEQLQALGPDWETAGYPQMAEYVRTQGEAVKKTVVIQKGER